VCVPAESEEVEYAAVPELTVTAGSAVPSMIKVTLPLRVLDPVLVTVAVKVIEFPRLPGFALDTSVVVVAESVELLIVSVKFELVLGSNEALPP
jgi:hypothetical protein